MSRIDILIPTVNFDQEFEFKILLVGRPDAESPKFTGFYRKDLSDKSENWHYYQDIEGRIYEFRKEQIQLVIARPIVVPPTPGDGD